MDLGNDLTLAAFNAETEKRHRALSAVGVKYGKDSNEYEMAGGTCASEINYHPPEHAGGNASGRRQ